MPSLEVLLCFLVTCRVGALLLYMACRVGALLLYMACRVGALLLYAVVFRDLAFDHRTI